MATQHPDSTVKVSVQEEVGEAIQAYTLFGCARLPARGQNRFVRALSPA